MQDIIRPFETGFFLVYDSVGEYEHSIGGPNDLTNGNCPCCGKPLFLHLTLDMADPRLGWPSHQPRLLKLLYCMRCDLCSDMFAYRLVDENRLEVIVANKGRDHIDYWQKEVGLDIFPRRQLDLRPVGQRYEELAGRLNRNEQLTSEEEEEFASYTDSSHTLPTSANQVGGRPYVPAVQWYPLCPVCCPSEADREKYCVFCQAQLLEYVQDLVPYAMTLVACIGNDRRAGVRISYPGTTVMFYVCMKCGTIAVHHYLSN